MHRWGEKAQSDAPRPGKWTPLLCRLCGAVIGAVDREDPHVAARIATCQRIHALLVHPDHRAGEA